MVNTTVRSVIRFVTLLSTPASLLASPMISIDTADFNAGTIREGEVKAVKHVYKVKNTGDSVLQIKNVRPG